MQTNEPSKSTFNESDDKLKTSNDDQPKPSTEQQQQSDPQITELKGLTDPDEPIEVEGTDNDV